MVKKQSRRKRCAKIQTIFYLVRATWLMKKNKSVFLVLKVV